MEPMSRKTKPWVQALIAVGAIALFVGIGADFGGFFGGMLQGAGFGVSVVGAYFLGMLQGRESAEPAVWLPSRDSGR